ncbi:MAG: GGDEF domain-containing protein [Lachnospiraceae bacterium]|nr:GGDEF domain-containing protein [Lachnospiraceae bacterium]
MSTNKKIAPVLSLLTAILIIIIFSALMHTDSYKPDASLINGWDIYYNSNLQNTQNIEDFQLKANLNKDDVISISRTLTFGDYDFPLLLYKSQFSATEVYLNNELIYEWGIDRYRSGKYLFNKYHLVSLPHELNGKELTIVFYSGVSGLKDFCVNMSLGEYSDVQINFLHYYFIPFAVSIFLIVFGITLVTISLIFYVFLPELKVQIYSSLFCLFIGIWLQCYYDLQFIFMNDKYTTITGFVTLYLLIPLGYLVVGEIQIYLNKKIFNAIGIVSSILCFILILLHFFDILYFIDSMYIFFAIGFVLIFITFYEFIVDCFKHKIESGKRLILLSLVSPAILILISGFLSLLRQLGIPINYRIPFIIINLSPIIYPMFILLFYLTYITNSYALKKEYASLTRLAYADGLTDLPNRSLYEKDLIDLDNINCDYCIVSLDLNGLKWVNDNMGHNSGDSLLKDFSTTLKKCFEENGTCYRIGGDEFTVIMKDTSEDTVIDLLHRLTAALQAMNVISPKYNRSVAYGYAFRHERIKNNARMIYLLADKRMYAMKKKQHERSNPNPRI